MTDTSKLANINEHLDALSPKAKEPNSKRVLDSWISHAEASMPGQGDRLAWLIATTIVTSMLQQIVDESGSSRFFLKGGVLLQHVLDKSSRSTKDLDGIVRGDIDDFLVEMDKQLQKPWGPLTFRRSEIEIIRVPSKIVNPRKLEVMIMLKGQTWRRIKVEISPDEGNATSTQQKVPAPSLAGFGLPTPDYLVGLSMSYQIAQKVHAASDPHKPPGYVNNRPRDVVDLILLKHLVETTGEPKPADILASIEDIFQARAREASSLGRWIRQWPAKLTPHSHWAAGYTIAAESAGIELSLTDAVNEVNSWLEGL